MHTDQKYESLHLECEINLRKEMDHQHSHVRFTPEKKFTTHQPKIETYIYPKMIMKRHVHKLNMSH